jgi:hypothetical protein
VARLRLSGLRPDVIAADQFRLAVGAIALRSTAFALERQGRRLRLTGHGFGHGVGMCVIGAGRRAARGESARTILAQYYPGLDLTSLSGVPSTVETATKAAPRPPLETRPAATAVVAAGPIRIAVTVPSVSSVSARELEQLAGTARDTLARTLGVPALAMTIRLHDTLDSFRLATNRPWWVTEVAEGSAIDLAPVAVLTQRGGVENSVRVAIAELLIAAPLRDRPAWVRIGAARYYARGGVPSTTRLNTPCPSDAELTLAVSLVAQRDAEFRAEACFEREVDRTKDWRTVR